LSGFPKLALRPDYGLTSTQLYQQVTVLMVQETKSLKVLSFVEARGKRPAARIQGLPSWVPDFGRSGNLHIEVPREAKKYCAFNASKYGSSSTLDFQFEQATLKLQGMRLATVTGLGQSRTQLEEGQFFERTMRILLGGPPTYFNGQLRIEAWWRTCLGDMTRTEYPAPAELQDSFAAWLLERLIENIDRCTSRGWSLSKYLATMSSYEELEKSDTSGVIPPLTVLVQIWNERAQKARPAGQTSMFDATFATDLGNRSQSFDYAFADSMPGLIFGALEGYMGNGPNSLQNGDRIWIIKGSDVPLAARKFPNVAGDGSHYQFLGEAYVHGAMHGEALYGKEPEWETLCLV
jgi:hypothetical protein